MRKRSERWNEAEMKVEGGVDGGVGAPILAH